MVWRRVTIGAVVAGVDSPRRARQTRALSQLVIAQLAQLPRHQFPALRQRLGARGYKSSRGDATSKLHPWWRRFGDNDVSTPLVSSPDARSAARGTSPQHASASAINLHALLSPPASSKPRAQTLGNSSRHLLEPDHPRIAAPHRHAMKDKFLHAGELLISDMLDDVRALWRWRYNSMDEQVVPTKNDGTTPSSQRMREMDVVRAWVACRPFTLHSDLDTAQAQPYISRHLAGIAPMPVQATLQGATSEHMLTRGSSTSSLLPAGDTPVLQPTDALRTTRSKVSGDSEHLQVDTKATDSDSYSDDDFEAEATDPAKPHADSPGARDQLAPLRIPAHAPASALASRRTQRESDASGRDPTFPVEAIAWQMLDECKQQPSIVVGVAISPEGLCPTVYPVA